MERSGLVPVSLVPLSCVSPAGSTFEVVAKGSARTYAWPGEKVMGEALDEAFLALLADLPMADGWPR